MNQKSQAFHPLTTKKHKYYTNMKRKERRKKNYKTVQLNEILMVDSAKPALLFI
jgi:hypothetical protein